MRIRHHHMIAAAVAFLLATSCKREIPVSALRDIDPAGEERCSEANRIGMAHQLEAAVAELDQTAEALLPNPTAVAGDGPKASGDDTALAKNQKNDTAGQNGDSELSKINNSSSAGGDFALTDPVAAAEAVVDFDDPKLASLRSRVLDLANQLDACLPDQSDIAETASTVANEGLALTNPGSLTPQPSAKGGMPPAPSTSATNTGAKGGTTPGLGGAGTKPGTTPGLSGNNGTKPNGGSTPGLSGNSATKPSGGGTPGLSNSTPSGGGGTPPGLTASPAAPYHQVLGKLSTQYAAGNSGTGAKVPVGTLAFKPLPAKSSKAEFETATEHLFGDDKKSQSDAHPFYQHGRDNEKPAVIGRESDIEKADPDFSKFTSLVGKNPGSPKGWNPANNMVFLEGLKHRSEPIFMATDPADLDSLQSTKKDGSMRPAVLAHEISELKKAGWSYQAYDGAPKNGLWGQWNAPK